MNLLDLPPELFESVVSDVVTAVGIGTAWKLRLTCKTFKAYIERNIFQDQPLSAFRVSDGHPYPLSSKILWTNLGLFLEGTIKKPKDVHHYLPSLINRHAEYFAKLDGGIRGTSDSSETLDVRNSRMVKRICNIIGDYAKSSPHFSRSDADNVLHSGMTYLCRYQACSVDCDAAFRLIIAAAIDDGRFLPACMADGGGIWGWTPLFHYPLGFAALYLNRTDISAKILCLLPASVVEDETRLKFMQQMLECVIREALRQQEFAVSQQLIDWYGKNMPPCERATFHTLITEAIDANSPDSLRAVFNLTSKKNANSITWGIFQRTAKQGGLGMLQTLLELGKFTINRRYYNSSAIHKVLATGVLDLVKCVLDHGADPDGPKNTESRGAVLEQPLRVAMQMNRADMVDLLLQRGATLAGHISNNEHTLMKFCREHASKLDPRIGDLIWAANVESKLPAATSCFRKDIKG